ncbi:MAG TPA: hypothetical protein VFU14_14295 [Acidimicrobiales bacterium]|nr:hypothetical protein [Acidimicrobiales bacterium]
MEKSNGIRALAAGAVVAAAVLTAAAPVAAHEVHHVKTGPSDSGHKVYLANDRNHGAVVVVNGLATFCVDVGEPINSGHTLSGAMYGIETAHHGPDAGAPGASDGCYATDAPPTDHNPAID